MRIAPPNGRVAFQFPRPAPRCCKLMIEQGFSPKKIQTVMEHSSIQVTFDIYGHLFPTPDDDAKAMALLEARLMGH